MTNYYELSGRETPPPNSGGLRLPALLCCGLCSEVIDSMGGPGWGVVCEHCGDELKAGRLRGAVVWEDDGKSS
ncbi:hypothetical protein [Brucella anthropi]|uniref:hypothetical protein n=1 Tax=Brucella anthropi TaxID=529 RepID=UPI0039871B93